MQNKTSITGLLLLLQMLHNTVNTFQNSADLSMSKFYRVAAFALYMLLENIARNAQLIDLTLPLFAVEIICRHFKSF